ncbi:unnamed protein product [Candidula unifasciata]|uniref:Uncharacterized protein n=1 Tax=Candidula unifasciata TaxID=100452 RepID=A0A8S3ZWU4_9EUPU|nr:unnamed protein product [Candidula unifasciata]
MGRVPVIVGLICLLAILEVRAQNPGKCLDELTNDIKANKSICKSAEQYINCVLREAEMSTANLTDSQMQDVAKYLNFTIVKAGVRCDINYMAILEKLRQVDVTFAHAPSEKKGYDQATTVGDCLNSLFESTEKVINLTCPLFAPNVKCMVRTTDFYRHKVGSKEYENINDRLNMLFRAIGMDCEFDFQAVAAEVASEQETKNSDPGFSCTTPVMLVLLLPWIYSFCS